MKKIMLYFLLLMAVPATAQPGFHGHHSHHHAPAHSNHAYHPVVPGMNPRDYEEVVRMISEENFDEKRLTKAERIIVNNPMSARQIAGICQLFTFEANRLEFAKFAYHHCVDPNRYYVLDEVFTFNSSKEELYEFTRKHIIP